MNFQELSMKRVDYKNSFFDTFRSKDKSFDAWFKIRQNQDKQCLILSDHNFGGLNKNQSNNNIKAFCYVENKHDKTVLDTNDTFITVNWLRIVYIKAIDCHMYDDIFNTYINRVAALGRCGNIYISFDQDLQSDLYDALNNDLHWDRIGRDKAGNLLMVTSRDT